MNAVMERTHSSPGMSFLVGTICNRKSASIRGIDCAAQSGTLLSELVVQTPLAPLLLQRGSPHK